MAHQVYGRLRDLHNAYLPMILTHTTCWNIVFHLVLCVHRNLLCL